MNHIESLPGDIFEYILDHLNNNTGSKELVNHADIPVVIRYANRLTSTSKTMAAKINQADTFQLFLTSLQQRFGQSCVHFASMMNTSRTRKWMWNHIQANGDAKTYQVETIHAVFEALLGVLKNNKNAALWTEFLPETRIDQGCVWVWDLYQDNTSVLTPFGKISYRFVNSENKPVSISPDDEEKLRAKAIEIDKKNLSPLYDFTTKNHKEHDWFIWETLKTEKLGLDPTPRKPKPTPTSSFDHISELTGWATKLMDRLQIQPCHSYTENCSNSLRQLKLEKNSVGTLCALNYAAKCFLYDSLVYSWVLCFDHDPEKINLKRPTVKGVHDDSIHDSGLLNATFNTVIKCIGLNWKQAKLKDYPALLHIKSEEDYILLIKTEYLLLAEWNLINCVAVQLGLSTSLLSGESKNLNYLWVKKEGLQDTLKALNINL